MTLREFAVFLGDFALFWPGIVLSSVVSFALSRPVARELNVTRRLAWALGMATGLVLSATVTPSRDALTSGTPGNGSCDMSRISPPPLFELSKFDLTTLNILLFLPLGIALALLPPSRFKGALIIGGLAMPFGIEATQLFVTSLGRACQSADMIDNVTGLLAGLTVGAVATRVSRLAESLSSGLRS